MTVVHTTPQPALPIVVNIRRDLLRCSNNLSNGGTKFGMEIIAFEDGCSPTSKGLPELNTIRDIERLTDEQTVSYCVGYGMCPIPQFPDERKFKIAQYIGCTVSPN
ncbi:hypothetical protein EIP91_008184 [Steccherinum ochraceum]|uniref:Mug135-like C-terminal domain-containing protein n=1 Tax=Steccherinum ochraceum TaxID=92696 RepID=A0A4R0RDB0_9APHY|nr:hypothetical protein EIP91_008184 [Steccherinum ochraceum]